MAEQWWYPGGLTDTSFTSGPTAATWEPHNFLYGAIVTLGGAAGTCTFISVRSSVQTGGPYNVKIGLYNSSLTLVAQGTTVTNSSPAWRDVAISGSVTPGTHYVMVSAENTEAAWFYNTSGDGRTDNVVYASAMPASLTAPGTESGFIYAVRMYVVEASAEGPPINVRLDEPELGSGEFE